MSIAASQRWASEAGDELVVEVEVRRSMSRGINRVTGTMKRSSWDGEQRDTEETKGAVSTPVPDWLCHGSVGCAMCLCLTPM